MIRLFISLLLVSLGAPLLAEETRSIEDFRAAADKANAVLTIPDWPQTPEAVDAMTKDAIAKASAALDTIGKQDLNKATFKSTIVALDDLRYAATLAAYKANIIKQANTSAAMRTAGKNAVNVSRLRRSHRLSRRRLQNDEGFRRYASASDRRRSETFQ